MKSYLNRTLAAGFLLAGIQLLNAQDYTTANAINNSGQIAGGTCADDCNEFHATLISRRGLTDYGTFGGPGSVAFGLNDRGEVVGQSDTDQLSEGDEFISIAFLVDRSGLHSLGTLAGYGFSQAFAINNAGLIVGRVYNSDPEDPAAPMRAVTFTQDGAIQDLGTLGGLTSLAFGLNDIGQIVGRSSTTNGEQHAFVYDRGVMTDLGTLGGDLSTARAINNRGWIVGGSRLAAPGQRHAFVVMDGIMRDLGALGGSFSEAFAINGTGLIVGAADTSAGERHAFACSQGTITDLGTLGGTYSVAFGVNDRGDIVGEAETASGQVHAFLYSNGMMRDLTVSP
jgi:probable HAF family extracellular repeat protein